MAGLLASACAGASWLGVAYPSRQKEAVENAKGRLRPEASNPNAA